MATRQYIGARYVPKFYQNSVDGSTQWEANVVYEPLIYVTLTNGHMYISKKQVPATVGTPASNIEYWLDIGSINGFVEELQGEVDALEVDVQTIKDNAAYVTPQMYGAIGDGATDDTAAFVDALASGKNLYVPNGTYKIMSTITVPAKISIVGASNAVINYGGTHGLFKLNDYSVLSRLTLNDNTTGPSTEPFILINNKRGCVIKDCKISNAYYLAIGINKGGNIWIVGNEIDTTRFHSGIARYHASGESYPNDGDCLHIIGNKIHNTALDGVSVGGCCEIKNNVFEYVGVRTSAAGIYCAGLTYSVIDGNTIHHGTGNGIDIAGSNIQNFCNEIKRNIIINVTGVGILLYNGVRNDIMQNFIYDSGSGGTINGGACISLLYRTFLTTIVENYFNTNPNSAYYIEVTCNRAIVDRNSIEGTSIPTEFTSNGTTGNYQTYDLTTHIIE